MSIASRIDLDAPPEGERAEIVLGEDWEGSELGTDAELHQRREQRTWLSMNSSPLARKIVIFNLIALVILVAGVLYINPFRDSLVEQRERALITEASLVADVVSARLPAFGPVSLAAGDGLAAEEALTRLRLPPGVEVFVFDPLGTLVSAARSPGSASEGSGGGTLITDFLNSVWEGFSGLFSRGGEGVVALSGQELARSLSEGALAGEVRVRNMQGVHGDSLFGVAAPIRQGEQVVGVLAMTTLAGELDQLVRQEREQVLRMFVIALLVSIGLSLVLASTIANPLSDLAAAAELGRDRNARKMSPDRVRIPDLSSRPDEIGRLSSALRGMVAALYDRIEANEQFAADVSHELKNPLSSLRSAVETLRGARTDVQRGKLLDVIEHDVRRLDRLVTEISAASRLDSDLVKEEMEPFDLVRLLRGLAAHHALEARRLDIDFVADLPDRPIRIQGLEARLAQVFVNLLTNAISFCEPGDAVRVWARQRDNRVLVVVEDTGPGIPEASLGKIFRRFYSERPVHQFGDHSGLGLSISKQIVEAHGGVIWAENIRPTEADRDSDPLGARFVVGLPV